MSVQEQLIQALGLQAAGQADAAAALFRGVLAAEPGNAHASYSLGLLAMNAGDLPQALQWCDAGIAARLEAGRFSGSRARATSLSQVNR